MFDIGNIVSVSEHCNVNNNDLRLDKEMMLVSKDGTGRIIKISGYTFKSGREYMVKQELHLIQKI